MRGMLLLLPSPERGGLGPKESDCIKTNPPVLSFPRNWVEDSTRRESSLCSQGMDPRFRGDDTSVDFSHSLTSSEVGCKKTQMPCIQSSFGRDQDICIFPKRRNYFSSIFRFFEIKSHRCFTLMALRNPSSGVWKT
jgi:hypothetical protein